MIGGVNMAASLPSGCDDVIGDVGDDVGGDVGVMKGGVEDEEIGTKGGFCEVGDDVKGTKGEFCEVGDDVGDDVITLEASIDVGDDVTDELCDVPIGDGMLCTDTPFATSDVTESPTDVITGVDRYENGFIDRPLFTFFPPILPPTAALSITPSSSLSIKASILFLVLGPKLLKARSISFSVLANSVIAAIRCCKTDHFASGARPIKRRATMVSILKGLAARRVSTSRRDGRMLRTERSLARTSGEWRRREGRRWRRGEEERSVR